MATRFTVFGGWAEDGRSFADDAGRACIEEKGEGGLRAYRITTTAALRDNEPPDKAVAFAESPRHAVVRSGHLFFDGLYALAICEALQNSVGEIRDGAYRHGRSIPLSAFQTGALWPYVWTRDLSYAAHLALAGFDPPRTVRSLLFKTSGLKRGLRGLFPRQIVQDTGSGGSYPVSTDRVVWALGAHEALKHLSEPARSDFMMSDLVAMLL